MTAFKTIEELLSGKSDNNDSFVRSLKQASQSDPFVRKHSGFLKQSAKLRNIYAHRNDSFAIPTEEVIEELEHIAERLSAPPKVMDLFQRQVVTVSPEDKIGQALKIMREAELSQVPVYLNNVFRDILTTDALARWIGAHTKDGIADLDIAVADALEHKEDSETYLFLPRTAPLQQAIQAFEKSLDEGKRLSAILITHSGKESELPLGIVTVYDLPEAVRAMS